VGSGGWRFLDPATGFEFEARERARGDALDGHADLEGVAEGGADAVREVGDAEAGFDFDDEVEVEESAVADLADLVFADFGELAEERVDCGGVDIDPADADHVVVAADDAAVEAEGAGVVGVGFADEVAGAVAEHGAAETLESGDDEFAFTAFEDLLAGGGVEDFSEVDVFEDLETG
jgi:hypothetical protein